MIVEHLRIHLYLMMTTAQLLTFLCRGHLASIYVGIDQIASVLHICFRSSFTFQESLRIPRLISDLLEDYKFSSIMSAFLTPF